MKMTTRVAFENMKYHKSKNILIGIAIVLTMLLLFVIPTVGNGMISAQYEATNRLYPNWHALYRNVDEETVKKISVHHDIGAYGLRSDLGAMKLADASVSMIYMDKAGAEMYKVELTDGHLPVKENEIVVSEGILEELGQTGGIGDTITVPYQVYRNGGLDYAQKKDFVICGFLEDSKASREDRTYMSMVSLDCIRNEVSEDQLDYRFLFQIADYDYTTTNQAEGVIKEIAAQFGIEEFDMNINENYLAANYVDPVIVPAIAVIMAIIVVAGIITIYSIYYVSMNQRVQEFGRLGAIGATRRQIRQIVLREGFCVALIAAPIGLLLGTVVSKLVLSEFVKFSSQDDDMVQTVAELIKNGQVPIYHLWVYVLVVVVTLGTVYLSLVKPMRMAAKVSQTEAMRYHSSAKKGRSHRKGYDFLTIGRLTKRNLSDNKKKSMITIGSMAATGTLLIVVATLLSCADPYECTDSLIVGQYEITPEIESNNKEHPEREWSYIVQHNPLTDELKEQIMQLDGVTGVDVFSDIMVTSDIFVETEWINGIPENYADRLEKGLVKGKVSYEELKSGDKVVADHAILHWYPQLDVGSKLNLTIHDGECTYEKQVEIAAIGDYGYGMTQYRYLFMAKEAADRLSENDCSEFFHIRADKNYDPALEQSLRELIEPFEGLSMRTWKGEFETYKKSISLTGSICYIFLGILSVISIMNLVNTMINSVHIRKKELGMMQAIGMSDAQLLKMLQTEGLFYTAGTLIVSVGVGSILGYPMFLYARATGMFEIRNYHYPFMVTVIVSVVLLVIQVLLAFLISRSVRKDPLIERIRFSE